jgi:hypothetical protein
MAIDFFIEPFGWRGLRRDEHNGGRTRRAMKALVFRGGSA